MLIARATIQPAIRLGVRAFAAPAIRPEIVEDEAESSSAPHRRQAVAHSVSPEEEDPSQPVQSSNHQNRSSIKSGRGNALRSPARVKQLSKAQKQALALRDAQLASSTSNVDLSRVDENDGNSTYTAEKIHKKEEPTLVDLISLRPLHVRNLELWDPNYVEQYEKLFKTIDLAFIKDQLRNLVGQLGLPGPRGKRAWKNQLVRSILISWGWPPPTPPPLPDFQEIDYPMSPAELFLFLKDRDWFRSAITKDQLAFSFVNGSDGSNAGTVLRAAGAQRYHKYLRQILKERREALKSVSFSSHDMQGFELPRDLLQTVSTLSGSYVEATAKGVYRATGTTELAVDSARQLMKNAALRLSVFRKARPLAALLPAPFTSPYRKIPDEFSLLPFTPSPSSTLPWELISAFSRPLFRLRKAGVWITNQARREMEQREEDVRPRPVALLRPIGDSHEGYKHQALSQVVKRLIGDEGETESRLTLTFGHLLVPSGSDDTHAILASPMPGRSPMIDTQKWFETTEQRPIFIPGLTSAMIHFGLTGPTKRVRRLRYRSKETEETKTPHYMTFSVTFPSSSVLQEEPIEVAETERASPVTTSGGWQDELERMFEIAEQDTVDSIAETSTNTFADGEMSQVEDNTAAGAEPTMSTEIGETNEMDMMLPDRPIDVRLSSSRYKILPQENVPSEIEAFFTAIQDKSSEPGPTAPALLDVDNAQLNQSYELISDDQLEIVESLLDVSGPETAGKGRIILRRVKSTEQGVGSVRPMTYTELETTADNVGPDFWREFANITRDVGPNAAALRGQTIFSY